MTEIIIFDFDGTIGTLVIDWTSWRNDIKDLIHEFDPDTHVALESIRHANQNDLIQKYGAEFREKLNTVNEHSELNLVTAFNVNKSILDFINNTNKKLYCWSSNSRKTLEKHLGEVGILGRFEKIISRENTYLLKPDNEGFKFIYNPEIPKEAYLLVGDLDTDRVAAQRSGIDFLHVDDFSLKA